MDEAPKETRKTPIVLQALKSLDSSILKGTYSNAIDMLGGSKTYFYLVLGFWVVVYASTVMALNAIRIGYHEAYASTREIPWGILISSYAYLVVTSTGLCIISAIGHIFGVKSMGPLSRRAAYLSIVMVFSGFICILMELENPFKMMLYNMLTPNLTSNIWWMGTLYGVFMAFMAIEFSAMLLGIHKVAVVTGLIAMLSEVAASSNLGAVFGMLYGREYWYGPYMPIFFIVSAVLSGCAAIMFFTWLAYKLKGEPMEPEMRGAMKAVTKLTLLTIAIMMFFTAWKLIIGGVGSPGAKDALLGFVSGPYAVNFWVFDVGLSLVLPFFLLLASKGEDMGLIALSGGMMLIGIFFMRYDMLVYGQIVAVLHSLGVNEYKDLSSYTPSAHEIAIVVGALATVGLGFLLGEKVLKGHKSESH